MTAGEHHTRAKYQAYSRGERSSYFQKRNAIAVVATALCVFAGGCTTSDEHQPRLKDVANVVNDLQSEAATALSEPTAVASPSLSYDELREASEYLQNEETVRTIANRALGIMDGSSLHEVSNEPNERIFRQTVSNYNELSGPDGMPCTDDDDTTSPVLEMSAIAYQGGSGVIDIRLDSAMSPGVCRGTEYPHRSVDVSVEVAHDGKSTFDLKEVVEKIAQHPSRAAVTSLSVAHDDERLYITNSTQRGTGLSGDGFSIKNEMGEVQPSTLREAQEIADRAQFLAVDVTRNL